MAGHVSISPFLPLIALGLSKFPTSIACNGRTGDLGDQRCASRTSESFLKTRPPAPQQDGDNWIHSNASYYLTEKYSIPYLSCCFPSFPPYRGWLPDHPDSTVADICSLIEIHSTGVGYLQMQERCFRHHDSRVPVSFRVWLFHHLIQDSAINNISHAHPHAGLPSAPLLQRMMPACCAAGSGCPFLTVTPAPTVRKDELYIIH